MTEEPGAKLAARIHAKYPRVFIEMHGRLAVNAFNLDDRSRTIEGSIRLTELGLDPGRAYIFDEPWAHCEDGKLIVKAALGPWGAKMASASGR